MKDNKALFLIASASLALALASAFFSFLQYRKQNEAQEHTNAYAELRPGKNLADINAKDITYDSYIKDNNGKTAPNNYYNSTGFIKVTPGEQYSLSFRHMISWYDKNKNFISGQDLSKTTNTAKAPHNAAFVRATVAKSAWEQFQIEKGVTPSTYEGFYYLVSSDSGARVVTSNEDHSRRNQEIGRVSLASRYYTVLDHQISLYRGNIFFNYRSIADKSSLLIDGGLASGRSTSITPTGNDYDKPIPISAIIADDNFNNEEQKESELLVSDESASRPMVVMNIGDSMTARLTFANTLISSPAINGITFVGNRYSSDSSKAIPSEGQGGWSMDSYNTVDFNGYLSPFMQPSKGEYLYFGRVEFWKEATSENPSYNSSLFIKADDLFDRSTGLLKTPQPGAVMSSNGKYITWSDGAWKAIEKDDLGEFSFSFAKYRRAWNAPVPDIVHILIGSNDFYSTTTTGFAEAYNDFKAKYDNIISSIKSDSPNANIIIASPPPSARQGIYGTLESERAENAYRMLAYALIRDYDNRSDENIYILDYHAVIDREFGFDGISEKPFQQFEGENLVSRFGDITHPSQGGFNQMGAMYMGIIQHLRSQATGSKLQSQANISVSDSR